LCSYGSAKHGFVDESVTEEMSARALRRLSLIAEDAATFGVPIAKMSDHVIAKKFGVRLLPGLVLFRRGRHIRYSAIRKKG